MAKKVYIFGVSSTGKTELLRQLTAQNNTSTMAYEPTRAPDFQVVNGLTIWDSTATNGKNEKLSLPYRRGAELGIYCVNLSQKIDEKGFAQIESDIRAFMNENPNAKLILVGTFGDQALPENTVESLRNRLQEFEFMDVLTVTTVAPKGTDPLLTALDRFKNEEKPELEVVQDRLFGDSEPRLNKLEALRDQFYQDFNLYTILDKLNHKVVHLGLKAEEIDSLGDEVNCLLVKITNPRVLDKSNAYNEFLANCDAKFTDKYHGLKAAIKTFAAAVFVTALAASLFFGVGIFFGAWTGASTFFAALAEGTTAASAFSAGTYGTGIISLAHYGYSFFQKPVNNAANEFIENIKNADIGELNINSTL